jgi:ABC-type transport system involved in cytochrome c biogenesis permease subunit
VWAAQARAVAPDDPNLQAMSIQDPKILIAILTWAVYSFAMLARQTLGWTGRRAAWLSALGFVIVFLTFIPVNYFVTTSHTFQ